jgi:prepilin-type processing-associated H-X9-DG protein
VGAPYWENKTGKYREYPESYIIEIEDHTDFDWSDMIILVDPTPDGQVRCQSIAKHAGFTFKLVSPDDRVIFDSFVPGLEWFAEGFGSYGMNNRAHRFLEDANKILMVEYYKQVANVVGAGALDFWPDMVQPRHLGMLNVLYADGRVQSHTPEEIDPRILEIHDTLWRPNLDPKLAVPTTP